MEKDKDNMPKEKKALLSVYIPERLFVDFKKKTVEARQTMTAVLVELMTDYISR